MSEHVELTNVITDSSNTEVDDVANQNQESNNFSIHRAVELGRLDNLKTLLKDKPDLVKEVDTFGRTPLHIAVQSIYDDNYETAFKSIGILLEFNADINSTISPKLKTPLNNLIRRLIETTNQEKQKMISDFIKDKVLFIDLSLLEDKVLDILEMTWNPDDYNELVADVVMQKLTKIMEKDEKQMIRTLYTLSKQPKFEEVIKNSIEINHFLDAAIENDLVLCVRMIIEVGKKFFTKLTLYRAIRRSWVFLHPQILKEILDTWEKKFGRGTYRKYGKMIRWRQGEHEVLYDILLEHPAIDVNREDSFDASFLYIAIIYDDSVLIEKLLSKNVFIGSLSHKNTCMPMNIIDPVLLENYFDSCIKKIDSEDLDNHDLCYRIQFNYTCFKPPIEHRGQINELAAIEHIAANKKLQHLIQHPLITSFLLLKWYPLGLLIFVNFFVYAINFIMLVAYMWWCYGQSYACNGFGWIPLVFAILLSIREFFQCILARKHYFSSISNFIELMLIVLTSLMYCNRTCFELDSNRRAVGALAILFATIEFMLLLGTIPIFSVSLYMSMLRKVTVTFLKAFVLYAMILIAFATSFYTLFGYYGEHETVNATDSKDCFKITNPGLATLKTIVMFTGEFEASNLNFEFSNWVGYIIFVMFVFLMAIIMMNLLSGLAVSDTQQIIADATLYDWIERIKLLSSVEKMFIKNNRYLWIIKKFLEVEVNNSKNLADIKEVYDQPKQKHSLDALTPQEFIRQLEVETTNIGHNTKKRIINGRLRNLIMMFGARMIFDFKIGKTSNQILEKRSNKVKETEDAKKHLEKLEQKLNELLFIQKTQKGQELPGGESSKS